MLPKPNGGSLARGKKISVGLQAAEGRDRQPKIAVVHPRLVMGGGSELTAVWIIETLKNNFDVTLMTMGKVDLEAINSCYGTDLKPDSIDIIEIPIPRPLTKWFDALRGIPLIRRCRREAGNFDLMISAYNLMNFGRPGIQVIADLSFDDKLRYRFHDCPAGKKSLVRRPHVIRSLYLWIAHFLAGMSPDVWTDNVLVVNSEWTRKVILDHCGVDSLVIHPPVVDDFPPIPWEKREDGFICLARLVSEKGIVRAIEIVEAVRKRGCDVHLHIIGRDDDGRYAALIRRMCAERSAWCRLEGTMFGEKKTEFIARHRYGISGCQNESFGIALAEMTSAGCLVFVPCGGGQVEIVGHPSLIYNDNEDAVKKIGDIHGDPALANRIRTWTANRARLFSRERFASRFLDLVREACGSNEKVDS